MPNHVTNACTVTGEDSLIERFESTHIRIVKQVDTGEYPELVLTGTSDDEGGPKYEWRYAQGEGSFARYA